MPTLVNNPVLTCEEYVASADSGPQLVTALSQHTEAQHRAIVQRYSAQPRIGFAAVKSNGTVQEIYIGPSENPQFTPPQGRVYRDERRTVGRQGRSIFIYGDRGVGKTSLAQTVAFAHQGAKPP